MPRSKKAAPWFLKYEKVYIVPTRFGLVFFFGVLTMLLVGATYANNLVNLLAFFLASLGLVAMVQTHNNLKGLRIQHASIEGGFAGATVVFNVLMQNPSSTPRYQLEIRPKGLRLSREFDMQRPVGPHSTLLMRSWYDVKTRGFYQIDRVRVSTVFPLGLFHAWMWFPVDLSYHVYPRPKGDRALPPKDSEQAEGDHAQAEGGEDFRGHRRYQTGDSPRHVDWKAHARNRPLLIKEFNDGQPAILQLNWSSLKDLETEARLSQLSAWIETAQRKQFPYSLNLPGRLIPSGTSRNHHQRCLEELARYQEDADGRSTS